MFKTSVVHLPSGDMTARQQKKTIYGTKLVCAWNDTHHHRNFDLFFMDGNTFNETLSGREHCRQTRQIGMYNHAR